MSESASQRECEPMRVSATLARDRERQPERNDCERETVRRVREKGCERVCLCVCDRETILRESKNEG